MQREPILKERAKNMVYCRDNIFRIKNRTTDHKKLVYWLDENIFNIILMTEYILGIEL